MTLEDRVTAGDFGAAREYLWMFVGQEGRLDFDTVLKALTMLLDKVETIGADDE